MHTMKSLYTIKKLFHATCLFVRLCLQGDLPALVPNLTAPIEVIWCLLHNRLLRMTMSPHLSKPSGRWRADLLFYWMHVVWQWQMEWHTPWLLWHSVAFIRERRWSMYSSRKEQVCLCFIIPCRYNQNTLVCWNCAGTHQFVPAQFQLVCLLQGWKKCSIHHAIAGLIL